MKLNAPNLLLSIWQDVFDPFLEMHQPKDFVRFALSLFCRLKMMKTQNSYFAENVCI